MKMSNYFFIWRTGLKQQWDVMCCWIQRWKRENPQGKKRWRITGLPQQPSQSNPVSWHIDIYHLLFLLWRRQCLLLKTTTLFALRHFGNILQGILDSRLPCPFPCQFSSCYAFPFFCSRKAIANLFLSCGWLFLDIYASVSVFVCGLHRSWNPYSTCDEGKGKGDKGKKQRERKLRERKIAIFKNVHNNCYVQRQHFN